MIRLAAAPVSRATVFGALHPRRSSPPVRRGVLDGSLLVAVQIRSSSSSSDGTRSVDDAIQIQTRSSPLKLLRDVASPVMRDAVLELWLPQKEQHRRGNAGDIRLIDGTIGPGGHALAAANSLRGENLTLSLLGIDRDAAALGSARKLLEEQRDDVPPKSGSSGDVNPDGASPVKGQSRFGFHHGSFAEISPGLLGRHALPPKVHGILLDLGGPNSIQIASAYRGFSFRKQGPLEMRYVVSPPDKKDGHEHDNDCDDDNHGEEDGEEEEQFKITLPKDTQVRQIVNRRSPFELASLFKNYSNECFADDIAAAILEWKTSEKRGAKKGPRGIRSTLELRYIIEEAVDVVTHEEENDWKQRAEFRKFKAIWRPPKRGTSAKRKRGKSAKTKRKHRLLRKFEEREPRYVRHLENVFRALRMEANNELEHLGMVFRNGIASQCLESGGRLVTVSYHPIEDALIKRAMEDMVAGGEFRFVTPEEEGLRPSPEEVRTDERSRGARLRAVERVG